MVEVFGVKQPLESQANDYVCDLAAVKALSA